MMNTFTESIVEQAVLAWLESLDYTILSGLEIAPGELQAERENYGQVVLRFLRHNFPTGGGSVFRNGHATRSFGKLWKT
jgi:hypothetical protein